jgi:cephalosporin-C deacetylase-like acetyl esterase
MLLSMAFAPKGYIGTAYRDYSRALPDFLRALAKQAYNMRNLEIAKLTSRTAIERRQKWARATFWRLAGGEPERTPLNMRSTGSFERSGYRVDKLLYESRPNLHVTANLYIPTTGKPPFPGVLFQMGHSANGKAYAAYQNCCQGLAQLGFLVLAFDPMGQGERIYYPDPSGTRSRLSSTGEHSQIGRQMLLVGDTASRFQVWDAMRSLDVLASHPLVDPKRIGVTGQSGGGTLTMLLLAADDRLAAAVVCSGNTENFACADYDPPGSTDDAEQNFLDSGPAGFDRWDVFYPFAPKPLLVTVSDKDFFGTYSPNYLSSGWEEFGKLKKVYQVLGHGEQLAWGSTLLPHSLAYDSRLQVYNWFARWLKGETKNIEKEPPITIEKDETLWATSSGNTVKFLHGETPFTLLKKSVTQQGSFEQVLKVDRPPSTLRAAVLKRVPAIGCDIEALEIAAVPGVWIPAWLFLPRSGERTRPVLLLFEGSGRLAHWQEGDLYQSLAAQGFPVCVPNIRGAGDLAPEYSRGAASYAVRHEDEEHYAWASMILGKPLVGQRVTDILAVAQALRSYETLRGRRLVIAAQGQMTVPAQFAAALDRRIDSLYLAGGLVSFRSVLETEYYTYPFTNFAPNLLTATDLPAVVRSLAPRRVTLAATVDAQGKKVRTDALEALYAGKSHVEIRPDSRWDMETLAGLG